MKKQEIKKLTKDQAVKKLDALKKDLFNIRFKKINNQIENPAQYSEIKKNIARISTNLKNLKNKDIVNVELDIFGKYIMKLSN